MFRPVDKNIEATLRKTVDTCMNELIECQQGIIQDVVCKSVHIPFNRLKEHFLVTYQKVHVLFGRPYHCRVPQEYALKDVVSILDVII